MSFQPETDSEDELPPEWEERATLGIIESMSKAFPKLQWLELLW